MVFCSICVILSIQASARSDAALADLVGHFENTVIYRATASGNVGGGTTMIDGGGLSNGAQVSCSANPSFAGLLRQVRQQVVAVQAHQVYLKRVICYFEECGVVL